MTHAIQSHRIGRQNPVTLAMRDFGIHCLSKTKHAGFKSYMSDRLEVWQIGSEKFLLRVDASNNDSFAWTNISPLVIRKMLKHNIKFACLKRNKNMDEMIIYVFSPEVILKHYETSGIRLNGHGAWAVRVKHRDADALVFKRVEADDVIIPCDDVNHFHVFSLGDAESDVITAESERTISMKKVKILKEAKNMTDSNDSRHKQEVQTAFELLLEAVEACHHHCQVKSNTVPYSPSHLQAAMETVHVTGKMEMLLAVIKQQFDLWSQMHDRDKADTETQAA